MTITVGAIYTAFPSFKPEDMIKLCDGNKELNGRTIVPLANIAAFGNKELSIFAAKLEGKNYTNLLAKNERAQVNEAAGVQDAEMSSKNQQEHGQEQVISMDTSIFDVAMNNKKKGQTLS